MYVLHCYRLYTNYDVDDFINIKKKSPRTIYLGKIIVKKKGCE